MIRTVLRLAIVGFWVAWVVDRVLRAMANGAPPPPIRSLVVIDAPIGRVWAVVADIDSQPSWMAEMKSIRVVTAGPVGVGTRAEATVRMFGIAVTDPVTVTEFQPPTRYAIAHEGTFGGVGVITLESGADGSTTIVRWHETLIAPVLPHAAALAMAPIFGAIFQTDLARLRDIVEAGADAVTAIADGVPANADV